MSRFLRWALSIVTMVSVAAVVFVVVAPARADDPTAGVDCGEPEAATLAVVDCSGLDPVPDLNPADTPQVMTAVAEASQAADALPADCRYHSEVAFYAATDWLGLVRSLALDRSPCVDFYVSVPPVVRDKTLMRPDQADRIREFGVHFHPMAEIHYATWRSWIASHPPNTFYSAGVEAGQRLLAAGYETWALNELPSSVRQGQSGARANAADFIRGLYDGSGGVPGCVFVVGVGQSTLPLDVYRTNLSGWLRDSMFWSDISGRVRFWAQEVYPDIRDWAVPGASREQRSQHLADYLMHPLALAQSLAADPTTAAARSFLADTYVALTNDAWQWSSGFGWTNVPIDLMQPFISEQVFAVRHYAGSHPQEAPAGRFGAAWAPQPQPPVPDIVLLRARTASALHYAYAQGGSSQTGACGPPGAHEWCQGELPGAAFVEGWATFPQTPQP
jgi:hypothetical protein